MCQILFFLLLVITCGASVPFERCSHLMPELNTCTLIDLHYNTTHFEFASHYDPIATLKVRVINSTLPKLGKQGICMPKYPETNNIAELDLQETRLEEILPDAFENCVHLKKIILRNNKLETLDENIFKGNQELEMLDLTNNAIRSLKREIFTHLTRLKELLLCNNALVEFEPQLIASCVNLEVVKLDSNKLFDLEMKKMIKMAPNLKTIAYNNNQIRCSRMKKMAEKLKTIFVDYEYEGQARVTEPTDGMLCLDDMAWSVAHYTYTYDKMMPEDY